jgi:hypothetical protein
MTVLPDKKNIGRKITLSNTISTKFYQLIYKKNVNHKYNEFNR